MVSSWECHLLARSFVVVKICAAELFTNFICCSLPPIVAAVARYLAATAGGNSAFLSDAAPYHLTKNGSWEVNEEGEADGDRATLVESSQRSEKGFGGQHRRLTSSPLGCELTNRGPHKSPILYRVMADGDRLVVIEERLQSPPESCRCRAPQYWITIVV